MLNTAAVRGPEGGNLGSCRAALTPSQDLFQMDKKVVMIIITSSIHLQSSQTAEG